MQAESEQKLRQIIDELFTIATPGNVKHSLWQAYQQALKESPASFEQETEAAYRIAADQARRDIPYAEASSARPHQYHFQSQRWYIEVDMEHHEPDNGAATALYRVWKQPDGSMAAMKVDIRERESEPEAFVPQDWRAIEEQARLDLEAIQTDQDAVAFIQKYFAQELQPDDLKLYRSDRHEMLRTPRQAIENLLSLPPL